MKQLTLEQFNRLKPYREHLTRGFYGRYTYALNRSVFDGLSAVYKELGYTRNLDYSCGGCLVQLTSILGGLFFPMEEKLKEEEKQQKLMQEDNEDENPDFTEEDITESHKEPVEQSATEEPKETEKPQKTAKKTNNTKTKKTNTRKKK